MLNSEASVKIRDLANANEALEEENAELKRKIKGLDIEIEMFKCHIEPALFLNLRQAAKELQIKGVDNF